jgi:hypothetical protein
MDTIVARERYGRYDHPMRPKQVAIGVDSSMPEQVVVAIPGGDAAKSMKPTPQTPSVRVDITSMPRAQCVPFRNHPEHLIIVTGRTNRGAARPSPRHARENGAWTDESRKCPIQNNMRNGHIAADRAGVNVARAGDGQQDAISRDVVPPPTVSAGTPRSGPVYMSIPLPGMGEYELL